MSNRCFMVGVMLLLISGYFWVSSDAARKQADAKRKQADAEEELMYQDQNSLEYGRTFLNLPPRSREEKGAYRKGEMEEAKAEMKEAKAEMEKIRGNAKIAGFMALGAFAAGFIVGPAKKASSVPPAEES